MTVISSWNISIAHMADGRLVAKLERPEQPPREYVERVADYSDDPHPIDAAIGELFSRVRDSFDR